MDKQYRQGLPVASLLTHRADRIRAFEHYKLVCRSLKALGELELLHSLFRA